MAQLTITMIYCVQQATGTDFAVNESLAALPATVAPAELGLGTVLEAVRSLPGVLEAVDTARSDPDDLYVTSGTRGSVDDAIWPGGGETNPIQAGQSVAPMTTLEFSSSQNLSLWDWDTFGDDLLGSVTVLESEQGQGELAKLASSSVEGSVYYISYVVE